MVRIVLVLVLKVECACFQAFLRVDLVISVYVLSCYFVFPPLLDASNGVSDFMLFWCITHAHAVEQALSIGTVEAKIARYFLIRALGAGGGGGGGGPRGGSINLIRRHLFFCYCAMLEA